MYGGYGWVLPVNIESWMKVKERLVSIQYREFLNGSWIAATPFPRAIARVCEASLEEYALGELCFFFPKGKKLLSDKATTPHNLGLGRLAGDHVLKGIGH